MISWTSLNFGVKSCRKVGITCRKRVGNVRKSAKAGDKKKASPTVLRRVPGRVPTRPDASQQRAEGLELQDATFQLPCPTVHCLPRSRRPCNVLLRPALTTFEDLFNIWRDLNVGAHDAKVIPVPFRGCRESTENLSAHVLAPGRKI